MQKRYNADPIVLNVLKFTKFGVLKQSLVNSLSICQVFASEISTVYERLYVNKSKQTCYFCAELWKRSTWLALSPAASCIMCNLETGGTQDCRVISHKRFQTTTWQKLIHNMPTVDISETNTWQMEREFTKLCLEPPNWWVWGRLRQSDQHCIFFSLAVYALYCDSRIVLISKKCRVTIFG